jgi:carboxypeptidase C (cathepsin A)
MQWDGADAFAAAPLTDWRVGGKSAGTARAAQGLTFLEVNAAGHMVPMDQPKAALNMVRTRHGYRCTLALVLTSALSILQPASSPAS